jgi:PEP-CTERM motif
MRKLSQILAVLVGSLFAVSAHASTFTLNPSTPGLTFTIENLGAVADLYGADGATDSYEIQLILTTSTSYVDTGDADLLAAFSIDFGTSALDAAWLVSGPPGFSWSSALLSNKVPGGSAKCNGSEPGSLCVEETPSATGNLALDANATYSWLFRVDLGATGFGDTTSLTAAVATLKQTGPSYAFQGSTVITGLTGSLAPPPPRDGEDPELTIPAPEPGSLFLLGSGLVFAASRMRRGKN